MNVTGGSTDVTTYFVLRLAATGVEATGLTITNFDLQYVRTGAAPAAKEDATALAATDSAHADNKAIEVDATDQPGLYRVDWPDAAFAAGVKQVHLTVKCATCFTEHLAVDIDPPVNVTRISGDDAAADNCESMFDGTGYAGGTAKLTVDLVKVLGTAPTEGAGGRLAAGMTKLWDVASPVLTAASVNQTGDAYGVVNHADYGNAKLVRSTTPANTLTVGATGLVAVPDTQKVDVETIKTRAITCAAGVTIRADVGAAAAPGAANGMLIGGNNAATTFATLTSTGAFTCGSTVLGNVTAGTVTQTGAASWGATTLASVAVTGALSVGTTTTLTGNVTLSGTLGVGNTTLANLTVSGTSALGAITGTTCALSGAVSFGSTFAITGTTTFTGNVALSGTLTVSGLTSFTKGMAISNSTVNGSGFEITGNGTAPGMLITGGSTSGTGLAVVAGAPNGVAFYALGSGSGSGFRVDGGGGDGPGILINAGATNSNAIRVIGAGTGHGISVSSGAGATGNGINIAAASTNGFGAYIVGAGAGDGMSVVGGVTGDGLSAVGGGTSGNGVYAKAAGTGHGFAAHGGGIAGDGMHAEADNDGDGIEAIGVGAGNEDITGTLANPVTIAVGGIVAGAHAAAELNAIADAYLDRNMATGVDSGTNTTVVRTPRQAYRVLRNKRSIAGTTLTVTKENDSTTSWTAEIATGASDPVNSVDPT